MPNCPGCARFLCDDCTPTRNAPYFARMTRKEWPEGWPEKGYREKRANGKTYTVSAHDLIIRMLEQAVRDGRAAHDREMADRVGVEDRKEGWLF